MKSADESTTFLPQPNAANLVRQQIDLAVSESSWLQQLKDRLLRQTGTRLFDWVDHIYVDTNSDLVQRLADVGFVAEHNGSTFEHPTAMFPRIIVADNLSRIVLGIKVESIEDFIAKHKADVSSQVVNGEKDEQLRIAQVTFTDETRVHFVERHGYRGFVPGNHEEMQAPDQAQHWLEAFRDRLRSYSDPEAGFASASETFQAAAAAIGRNRACDLFFRTEREYWESRNKAARVQKERQAAIGMGWANHDHHTYRCSRESFASLVAFLELTGFHCRERFYAGSDAGWGAQVLEHTECGIVVFADVDMSEDELSGDFAHDGLPPKAELGTVGLWCKLHGDSFLSAGMHHLECQFDFKAATEQLADAGIPSMKPFTDFPYLKQAFTVCERWQVPNERLQSLFELGVISREDAQRFETEGAIGSHLEILERNDGYKGFNQTGISHIIQQTNPKNRV